MDVKTYRELVARGLKRRKAKESKYHAQKVVNTEGVKFDSRKEKHYNDKLQLLLRAGKIKDLKLQVPFILAPAQYVISKVNLKTQVCVHKETKYVADFTYLDLQGNLHVVDVKGFRTDVYKKKKHLMKRIYGIEIEEV